LVSNTSGFGHYRETVIQETIVSGNPRRRRAYNFVDRFSPFRQIFSNATVLKDIFEGHVTYVDGVLVYERVDGVSKFITEAPMRDLMID